MIFFDSISVKEFEKIATATATAAGAEDMIKSSVSKNIVLHQGKRMDNGEDIIGFLTKMWGMYHIVLEDDENTAYPVEESSIQPCLQSGSQKVGLFSNEGIDTASFTGPNIKNHQWNRWYVNEEMLPRLQDTVLICKGWYNKKKYENDCEALRAYWASIAMVKIEDVGYDAVLQCLLLPACEAFLCNRKFCEIFYDKIFKQDIMMREFEKFKKHKSKTEYREMNAEYLIELLIGALFKLKNDKFYFEKRPEDGYCVV